MSFSETFPCLSGENDGANRRDQTCNTNDNIWCNCPGNPGISFGLTYSMNIIFQLLYIVLPSDIQFTPWKSPVKKYLVNLWHEKILRSNTLLKIFSKSFFLSVKELNIFTIWHIIRKRASLFACSVPHSATILFQCKIHRVFTFIVGTQFWHICFSGT